MVYEKLNRAAEQWTKMKILMIKLFLTKKETLREKIGTLMEQNAIEKLELLRRVIDIGRMEKCI